MVSIHVGAPVPSRRVAVPGRAGRRVPGPAADRRAVAGRPAPGPLSGSRVPPDAPAPSAPPSMRERFDLRAALPRLPSLLVGLVLFGIGIALMVVAGLGLGPW